MAGELKVNLILATEQAKAALKEFLASAGIGGGKSFLGDTASANRDVSDIARNLASGGKATSKMVSDLDKISSSGGSGEAWANKLKGKLAGISIGGLDLNNDELGKMLGTAKSLGRSLEDIFKQDPKLFKSIAEGSGISNITSDDMKNVVFKKHGESGGTDPDAAKALRSKTQFYKDLTFLFQPLLNPTSIWGNMFAARQIFSAFSTRVGQRRIGGGGVGGALKATALLQGATLEVGISLKVLREAISFTADEIKKAIQFAHNLYGKSLSNGLSLGFTAKRQMAADVLGVDEKEVFRFKQGQMVMQQLSFAVGEISKNAPQLAYTSAQFKILEYDILAVGSDLAVKLSPAFNIFASVLDDIVKNMEKNIGRIMLLNRVLLDVGTLGTYELFRKSISAQLDSLKKLSGVSGAGTFGQPQSFMKQLGAGTFEKMGLVVSGGISNKTHDLIRQTNAILRNIDAKIGGNQGGVSRSFGMSPLTANP